MQSQSIKQCRKCRQKKSTEDFDVGFTGRLYHTCRECRSAYTRRAPGHWGDTDSKVCGGCDRLLLIDNFSWNSHANGRNYRSSRCRECAAKKCREWNARHRTTKVRAQNLFKNHGIRMADYQAMLQAQGSACAICGDTSMPIDKRTGEPYQLAVDHDHATGKIRALLCPNCNNGLGCFRDDPVRLHAAINYLQKHS